MKGNTLLKEYIEDRDKKRGKRMLKFSTLFNIVHSKEDRGIIEDCMEWAYNKALDKSPKRNVESEK